MEQYDKLVRDRIPERIERGGQKPNARTLEQTEFRSELKKKLVEEAGEVARAESPEDMQAEIADALEVIDTLITEYALDKAAILEIQRKKREERGGFGSRVFLESVE